MGPPFATHLLAHQSFAGPIDASLTHAVTEGYWQVGSDGGAYRVLVFSGGYEHVSSRVVAEWVAEPKDAGAPPTVSAGHELVAFGSYSLGAPEVTRAKNGLRVTLKGVSTMMPEDTVTCVFELHPKGQVTVVKVCE